MAERRTIGQILMSSGRISEADVERALEYQRDHGGYFGEALLACGIVSQEELEWGIASQFDLPYVFPEADAVDPDATAMVSPEWALAHLTLPILRTGESLTVVVESPLQTAAVDELAARTGLQIELALASPAKIRELIRQVYAQEETVEDGIRASPVRLNEAFGKALEAGASRFGISTRAHRSWAWWEDAGTIRRRLLDGLWETELEKLLSPPPKEAVGRKERARWEGTVNREGLVTPVEVRYLSDESGKEFLFRPIHEWSKLQERFPLPPPSILAEIRLLARSGSARFVVTSEPDALGHHILPHLPTLLLDHSWRSIYINAEDQEAAEEAFSLQMPKDPKRWAEELETLRAFHFDVVTVDLTGNEEDWAATALDVAAVAFLLWPNEEDRRAAYEAGIRWELHVAGEEGKHLEWSLEPLHV
ncbi:MAG: hypothetical protein ACE5GJ_08785 [Gemmatimonadota bacterium]